jgi:hypothetical protein
LRSDQHTEASDAVFFASTEVASFLFLFLSPFFSEGFVQLGWYALVCWRIAALGGVLYYGQSRRFSFLGRSLMYGAPFWVSSVLFPLRAGQQGAVGSAFLGYLVLLGSLSVLSLLKTHWYPGLMGALTFAFLYHDSQSVPWIALAVLVVVFWPRGLVGQPPVSESALQFASLSVGAGWAFCLYLAVVGGPAGLTPLSLALLHWSVVVAAAVDILWSSRRDELALEIEWSLPSLSRALHWKYSKALYRAWLPWVVVVTWTPWMPLGFLMGLAVALALPGLVALAANRQTDALQQFVCWQFVILWGIAESYRYFSLAWIPIAALTSLYLHSRKSSERVPELALCVDQPVVERLLRNLRQPVPEGFSSAVMSVLEPSVEFDDSLTSEAPKGFSKRLLDRLRQGEQEEAP